MNPQILSFSELTRIFIHQCNYAFTEDLGTPFTMTVGEEKAFSMYDAFDHCVTDARQIYSVSSEQTNGGDITFGQIFEMDYNNGLIHATPTSND